MLCLFLMKLFVGIWNCEVPFFFFKAEMVKVIRASDWKMFWLFNFKEIVTSVHLSSQIHVWQKKDYTNIFSPCLERVGSRNFIRLLCTGLIQPYVPTLAIRASVCLVFSWSNVLDQLKCSLVKFSSWSIAWTRLEIGRVNIKLNAKFFNR